MKNGKAVFRVFFISAWVVLFFIEFIPKFDLQEPTRTGDHTVYLPLDLPVSLEYTLTHKIQPDICFFKHIIWFMVFLLLSNYINKSSVIRFCFSGLFYYYLYFLEKKIIFLPREQIP
jgi:hypothetical protein